MSKLEQLKAYTLVKKQILPEVNGTGYILSHNKTKARVVVIENDDKNKVFTIGFRTPPSDDTGVPHITEHSVLCGSKKFPVKDPFVELCKGSLNTFLNAMTYSDKTVYPIASLNHADFHNLMHVYLDAVFYPNIYDKKEIMMQEGWHYEVDEETNELTFNGVVFNEMKGVFSSGDEKLYRIIEKSLLPDTAYSFESGGDPEAIPDLTQEAFLDFHKKYYHPSNSYIYLYGDMDAVKELEFIDEEYLSDFSYLQVDSALHKQEPFTETRHIEEYYSISDDEDEKNETFLSYNVVIGDCLDIKLCTAFSILEYVLLSAPGAPLKKALIDAGIGKEIESSFDDGILQPVFSIIARNANREEEETFIRIIDETLNGLVENGLDKKALLAAINSQEFKYKEGDYGRHPKGLMFGLSAFSTWLHEDLSALSMFSLNEVYDSLKKEIETGYYENLIETYLLSNSHKTYCMLCPKKGLNKEIAEKEKKRLADYKKTLTEEQIEEIRKEMVHLKQYQESPDAENDLNKIPMLSISDIDKNAIKISNIENEIEHVKVISHDIFTNGITYMNLNFFMDDIDYEKYQYASLLATIFKQVDTEHFSYNELSNEINLYTGGISFSTFVADGKTKDQYHANFAVSMKMLDEHVDKGMELVEEILFTTKLDDKKRLREIISEERVFLKSAMQSGAHLLAAGRAASYFSPGVATKERMSGMDYYEFICDLDENFENKYIDLVNNLKDVLGQILRRDSLLVNYNSDKEPIEHIGKCMKHFSERLSTRLAFDVEKTIPVVKKNEGFKMASQVQYVATAGNFMDKGLPYTGALKVLQTIFSYDYLWLNVRVKGGAYGCMCSFAQDGTSEFYSYRDPNLMETYEVYKKAPEYVSNFDADERDMTKYIIGTISKMDTPFTPASEGGFYFQCYLMGMTDEELQQTRDEVLATTPEVIRGLADYVSAIVDTDIICAIGDETRIEEAKENFLYVKSLF